MITKTKAQAAKARAEAATRTIPVGSPETGRLIREQASTLHEIAFTDVPELAYALEEAMETNKKLHAIATANGIYPSNACDVEKARNQLTAYYGREGGA